MSRIGKAPHFSVYLLVQTVQYWKGEVFTFSAAVAYPLQYFFAAKGEDILSVLPKEVAATLTGKGNASSTHPKAQKVSTKKKKQSCEQINLDSERIRTQWLQFCDTPYPFDGCKKLIMMFSSNVYNMMLQKKTNILYLSGIIRIFLYNITKILMFITALVAHHSLICFMFAIIK